MRIRVILPLFVLAGLLCTGCGEDNIVDPALDDPPEYGPYATPQELMDGFETAYIEQDIDHYDALLDERFLFFFRGGESQDSWGKTDDMISTDNLMCGEARTNDVGELTRAITRIDMDQLTLLEPFAPTNHASYQDIEGVQSALYKVRLVLHHNYGTITLDTNQSFHAVPVDDGDWRLIGQTDMPSKANEDMTWSSVKWLFR